jgi:hypothetical protein
MSLIAAAASWMRGAKYVHTDKHDLKDAESSSMVGDEGEKVAVGAFGVPEGQQPEPGEGPPPEEWVPA